MHILNFVSKSTTSRPQRWDQPTEEKLVSERKDCVRSGSQDSRPCVFRQEPAAPRAVVARKALLTWTHVMTGLVLLAVITPCKSHKKVFASSLICFNLQVFDFALWRSLKSRGVNQFVAIARRKRCRTEHVFAAVSDVASFAAGGETSPGSGKLGSSPSCGPDSLAAVKVKRRRRLMC